MAVKGPGTAGLILFLVVFSVPGICLDLRDIRLPSGFKIAVYAEAENARGMAISPSGILFVGSMNAGRVYAIVDNDRDNKADETVTVAEGLQMPVGVAFYNGDLYVSEVSRILKFRGIEGNFRKKPAYAVVTDKYPKDTWHGWKFIRFGPDGKLYVPVGAPCNICLSSDKIYATITRINPDGTGMEIFAEGIRNTVGFDWDPATGFLWFTDNGRDYMGDDLPPDELNFAPRAGMHFGYPYMHGKAVKDPRYYSRYPGGFALVPPAMELGPHVAALGMRFYTGKMFPEKYRGRIFIAEHGSWNRSKKTGYRVTMVKLSGDKAAGYEVFAEGWKKGERANGRPVDVENAADGSLFVSDDKAGLIYRIYYEGNGK